MALSAANTQGAPTAPPPSLSYPTMSDHLIANLSGRLIPVTCITADGITPGYKLPA